MQPSDGRQKLCTEMEFAMENGKVSRTHMLDEKKKVGYKIPYKLTPLIPYESQDSILKPSQIGADGFLFGSH